MEELFEQGKERIEPVRFLKLFYPLTNFEVLKYYQNKPDFVLIIQEMIYLK